MAKAYINRIEALRKQYLECGWIWTSICKIYLTEGFKETGRPALDHAEGGGIPGISA